MVLKLSGEVWKRIFVVLWFSAAFGYIESSVVVYLREIFYPDGFTFPIADFSKMPGALRFFLTEVGREAATLVLMYTAAILIAKKLRERIAYFMIIFAVWDIFYYVWLKVLLDWPGSLLDWDILFLIPMVWAGPVLAPVISSCVMLWIAWLLLQERDMKFTRSSVWGLAGCVVGIIVCFCVASLKMTEADFASVFSWPVFLAVHVGVVVLILRSIGLKI